MGRDRFVRSSFRFDAAPSAGTMILLRVRHPSSTMTSSSTSAVEVDRESSEHRWSFTWPTPRLEWYLEASPETALSFSETQDSVGKRAARWLPEKGRYRMMIPQPER